jgi:ABC-type transporter MlaC component
MTTNAMTGFKNVSYLPLATVLLALAPNGPSPDPQPQVDTADPRATVESHFAQWRELMDRREAIGDGAFTQQFLVILGALLDSDDLASKVLPDAGSSLTPREREQFARALEMSLKNRIVSYVEEVGDMPSLTIGNADERGAEATLTCLLETRDQKLALTVYMSRMSDGEWRLRDVEVDDGSLTGSYARRATRLLDRYSFPYLVAKLEDAPYVILEDFDDDTVGELPAGWQWKSQDERKRKPYKVEQEQDNKYLAARDEGESVIIAKDVKWDLREYPYVSFRWRVHEIPEGADERFNKKVDSAAGVYFVYRELLGLIPQSVKYVWSSTLPVGSTMQRSGLGKPWMIVAETGTDSIGEWRTYVFDAAQAYRDTFGGRPPRQAVAIGILSDANSMKARAYADYDDIRALRSADSTVTSGVREILEAQ